METGLVGLGKMGNNMRARLKKSGIDVVGYDTNPAVSDVADYAALMVGGRVVRVGQPADVAAFVDDVYLGGTA